MIRAMVVSLARRLRVKDHADSHVVATVVATTNAMATRTADDRKNSSICVQHEAGSADIQDQRSVAP
jgi:hypothetical protein